MLQYLQQCNLDGLSKVNQYVWRCRCPICGDSQKSLSKKRFYIYTSTNSLYCFNCNYTSEISFFLKEYYPEIYKDFISDTILNKKDEIKIDFENIVGNISLDKVLKVGKKYRLHKNVLDIKFVKDYIINRNLVKFSKKFWYIDNFSAFRSELLGEEITSSFDPRLLIPFTKNDTKEIYAMQARTLINKNPKYLTMILNPKYGKIYNYYNIDKSEIVYLLEGAIDSLFLPNSIALAGAKINKETMNDLKKLKIVVVLDNDFVYNINIRNSLKSFVNAGFKVFIPPKNLLKYKDLNEMICSYNEKEIKDLIDKNTYSGLRAKIMLSNFVIKGDI